MSYLFGTQKSPQQQQQPTYTALPTQTSSYGKAIPLIYGRSRVASNLLWYDGFQAIAHTTTSSAGGGKGGSPTTSSTSYTYQVNVIFGIGEGPIAGAQSVWQSQSHTSLAALNMGCLGGYLGQAPWVFLPVYYPAAADPYSGIAYVVAGPLDLGDSANLSNYNFEINGLLYGTSPNGVDADASLVVYDLLTNTQYGLGFPASAIGDLSSYRSFVNANGLWLSFALENATSAASVLADIATYTDSEFVWSQGKLNLVPRGTMPLTANGYTYTPPSVPLFDLNDDDFLPTAGGSASGSSSDPVVVDRSRTADQENIIKVEYLDRSNQYAAAIAEISDEALIVSSGQKRFTGTKTAHMFADGQAAHTCAQLLLQQQYTRNMFHFSLDERWIILDPMDIVTVSDSLLGLDRQWVRIVEISENDDGSLDVLAEEYLAGTGAAAAFNINTGIGHIPQFNVDPGSINKPIITEAPVELAATSLEIWAAISGSSPLWGGCDVWISSDGENYSFLGTHAGSSRMGFASATFPAHADPDEDNVLSVDLTESRAALNSGSLIDAERGNTLCLIDNELISYEIAILTGQYRYDLGSYIRRGLAGTLAASHAPGAPFVRLDDDTIVKVPYAAGQIGQTVWMKFPSFNIYSGGEQSLADVPAFSHLIVGPPPPGIVQNFTVTQQEGSSSVVFSWTDLDDFALKGYDIAYGPVGGNFTNANELTIASRTTEMTNASVPSGTWVFYIAGHDIVDQVGPASSVQFTVADINGAVLQDNAGPDWIGSGIGSTTPNSVTNVVEITGGTSWTGPTGVTLLDKVECIGTGGAGCFGEQGRIGAGGGGGAYASITSLAIAAGGTFPIQIGRSKPTYFSGPSVVSADFGKDGSIAAGGGAGGSAATSVGSVVNAGGNGSYIFGSGGGGGGAGGPSAAGGAAVGFAGGQGDGSQGGLGGAAIGTNLLTISNEFDNATLWTLSGYAISVGSGTGPVALTFGGGYNALNTNPMFSPSSNTTYTISCRVSGTTSFRFSGLDGNGNIFAPSADITPNGGRASWSVTTGTIGSGHASFALISNSAQAPGVYEISHFKVELGSVATWSSNTGASGAEHEGAGSGGGTGAGGNGGAGGLYGGGAGGNAETSLVFDPAAYGGNLLTASNLLSDDAWDVLSHTSAISNVLTFSTIANQISVLLSMEIDAVGGSIIATPPGVRIADLTGRDLDARIAYVNQHDFVQWSKGWTGANGIAAGPITLNSYFCWDSSGTNIPGGLTFSVASGATGAYDAYYTQMATNWANSTSQIYVICLNNEYNLSGSWPWDYGATSVSGAGTNATNYKATLQRMINAITVAFVTAGKPVPAIGMKTNAGHGDPTLVDPGDLYVDLWVMDLYAGIGFSGTSATDCWNNALTGGGGPNPYAGTSMVINGVTYAGWGLNAMAAYANVHGKRMGFDELGWNFNNPGNTDMTFLTNFFDWCKVHPVAYHSYVNQGSTSFANNPAIKTTYNQYYANTVYDNSYFTHFEAPVTNTVTNFNDMYAQWVNDTTSPITSFTTSWIVPPLPVTVDGQVIFFWNALVTPGTAAIVQPVLGLGNDGPVHASQGYWIQNAYFNSFGDVVTNNTPNLLSNIVFVQPGQKLTGKITLVTQGSAGKSDWTYKCSFVEFPQIDLTIPNIIQLTAAIVSCEASEDSYPRTSFITTCSKWPNAQSIVFSNNIVTTTTSNNPAGHWATATANGTCGENITVVNPTSFPTDVIAGFHGGP